MRSLLKLYRNVYCLRLTASKHAVCGRQATRLFTTRHTGGCNSFTHQSLLSADTDSFRLDSQFEFSRTYSHQYEEAITSLPSIAGDTVYYLGIDGLRCRSLSSGEEIRSSPVTLRDDADQLPESVSREPIVADGSVFVRSGNAVLAIEATDSS